MFALLGFQNPHPKLPIMNRLPHVVDLGFDALDVFGGVVNWHKGIFAVLTFDEIDTESGDSVLRSDTGRIEVCEDFIK